LQALFANNQNSSSLVSQQLSQNTTDVQNTFNSSHIAAQNDLVNWALNFSAPVITRSTSTEPILYDQRNLILPDVNFLGISGLHMTRTQSSPAQLIAALERSEHRRVAQLPNRSASPSTYGVEELKTNSQTDEQSESKSEKLPDTGPSEAAAALLLHLDEGNVKRRLSRRDSTDQSTHKRVRSVSKDIPSSNDPSLQSSDPINTNTASEQINRSTGLDALLSVAQSHI
jgi:hypothetical protein